MRLKYAEKFDKQLVDQGQELSELLVISSILRSALFEAALCDALVQIILTLEFSLIDNTIECFQKSPGQKIFKPRSRKHQSFKSIKKCCAVLSRYQAHLNFKHNTSGKIPELIIYLSFYAQCALPKMSSNLLQRRQHKQNSYLYCIVAGISRVWDVLCQIDTLRKTG